jgi:Flp pilus assembly pilin Flp
MLRKISKRAQTTAEYAILIALVVAAVTAMQIYVKRGLQGKVKDVVDDMGAQMPGLAASDTKQYEPYYLESTGNTNQNSTDTENVAIGGAVTKTSNANTNADRNQTMGWNGAP